MDIHVITRICQGTCDTGCVSVCPVDCIDGPLPLDQMRGGRHEGLQLFIDPEECIGCGACVPECPVEAIFADSEVPAEYAGDIAANRAFYEQR